MKIIISQCKKKFKRKRLERKCEGQKKRKPLAEKLKLFSMIFFFSIVYLKRMTWDLRFDGWYSLKTNIIWDAILSESLTACFASFLLLSTYRKKSKTLQEMAKDVIIIFHYHFVLFDAIQRMKTMNVGRSKWIYLSVKNLMREK